MAHINRYLGRDKIQRIIYIFFIGLFLMIWFFDDLNTNMHNIDWSFITILIFLAGQAILNNKFLWTIFLSLGFIYCILLSALSVKGFFSNIAIENMVLTLLFNLFSWTLLWVLYKIKPRLKKINAA